MDRRVTHFDADGSALRRVDDGNVPESLQRGRQVADAGLRARRRFFRAIPRFMVQFGIHADPA